MNGLECCRKVKTDFPDVQVLMLSMLEEVSLIKLLLKEGANGYLLKNAGKDEVLNGIRRVAQGKRVLSNDLLTVLMEDQPVTRNTHQSPIPKISRRERQVLELIVAEHTTAEIAEALFISFGTVETHRRNLLLKLDARNTAGLVRKALEYDLC